MVDESVSAVLARKAFRSGLRLISACALPLGLFAMPASADSVSTGVRLQASATIMKHAGLSILAQPASVLVTPADIARRYIDVPAVTRVAVQNNSRDGYLLMFENQGDFSHQIIVKGLGSEVQLDSLGGGVMRDFSGQGVGQAILELRFRFVLSASSRQGLHAWPVRLSVVPL